MHGIGGKLNQYQGWKVLRCTDGLLSPFHKTLQIPVSLAQAFLVVAPLGAAALGFTAPPFAGAAGTGGSSVGSGAFGVGGREGGGGVGGLGGGGKSGYLTREARKIAWRNSTKTSCQRERERFTCGCHASHSTPRALAPSRCELARR